MRRQQQEKRFTNLSYPIMLSKHYIILVCLPFVDKLDYPAPPAPQINRMQWNCTKDKELKILK